MSEIERMSEEERRHLAEVMSTLHDASDAVNRFIQAPLDNDKFEAVAALPVTLAKSGALLSKVVTSLADAKEARLAKLKARLDAVRAKAKV